MSDAKIPATNFDEASASEEEMTSKTATQSDKNAFQEEFESLEIPKKIDPKLLELWLNREREAIEKAGASQQSNQPRRRRKLSYLFASYIGIIVMCLTIILGFVQNASETEILASACRAFIIYAILGFVFGCIAEKCVSESVETLLREIIRRANESHSQ
ncbi:MAG: hypothetical protein ACRCUY_02055 [Thermoguttaceae bacterium]